MREIWKNLQVGSQRGNTSPASENRVELLTAQKCTPHDTLQHYFSYFALKYRKKTALQFGDVTLTYEELEKRAIGFAQYLEELGISPGDRIGIYMPRGIDMHVAILGTLYRGATYVPMDSGYPRERVEKISVDAQAKLLVTHSELWTEPSPIKVLFFDQDISLIAQKAAHPPKKPYTIPGSPEDIAYIIYTSGSTGAPKGVMIKQYSICHFILSESSILKLSSNDTVYQAFSVSFDMSLEEIWPAFCAGAKLLIASKEMIQSGPEIGRLLNDLNVTVLHCVPTFLSMLSEEIPSLRLINLGGEACPSELVKKWFRKGRRLLNTYGPTETTVTATYEELKPDTNITIGKPLPGYHVTILNESFQATPSGEAGELCIGGPGLSPGYVNDPTKTNEKFLYLPMEGLRGQYNRYYRSGDLARYNTEGKIEFLGRIDTQVKIRGFRVELSEIEAVLREETNIQNATVVLLKDESGMETLVGFVILKGEYFSESDALQSLKRKLPSYMIPSMLEVVAQFPTLPSGKADRKGFQISKRGSRSEKREAKPNTLLELQLHKIWSEIFSPLHVTIEDDFFFDLGGHSLRAAVMVSRVRKELKLNSLSMQDIYKFPTIKTLAAFLQPQVSAEQISSDAAPAMVFHAVPQLRYTLCAIAQAVGLFVIFSAFSVLWMLPYFAYSIAVELDQTRLMGLLFAFGSFALVAPLFVCFSILFKWLLIGKYQEGDYPVWGWYYFRWWFVKRMHEMIPSYLFRGTPGASHYFRLLGSKIGKNVYLGNTRLDAFDLIEIEDGASVGSNTLLGTSAVENGLLKLRKIKIESNCVLNGSAALGLGCTMKSGSELTELSYLSEGKTIPSGEIWSGSPAKKLKDTQPIEIQTADTTPWYSKVAAQILLAVFPFVLPLIALAPIFPGLAILAEWDRLSEEYYFLACAPLLAFLFILLTCVQTAALKRLFVPKVKAERIPLNSYSYFRHWLLGRLMDSSLDLIHPIYATLYLPPWFRSLGIKVGKRTEISTASEVPWDLLEIGDESFIADAVNLGAPSVKAGYLCLAPVKIGARTFVGNSACIPGGTTLGAKMLVGCLSSPPREEKDCLRDGTTWFGSPAIELPKRQVFSQFDEGSTFNPSKRLYALRLAIEFIRILLPATCWIVMGSLMVSLVVDKVTAGLPWYGVFLLTPAIYFGLANLGFIFLLLVKKVLVGTYSPRMAPLWSNFVWRSELVTCLYENLTVASLLEHLRGTPFLGFYLRRLGCKIGKRVYIDTTDITEHDVVNVGDDVSLNDNSGLQTHLFEDRVMKISKVKIGNRCTVGSHSIVLYDAEMEDGSMLGDLSMLMKAEVLPAGTSWEGSPAQRVEPKSC